MATIKREKNKVLNAKDKLRVTRAIRHLGEAITEIDEITKDYDKRVEQKTDDKEKNEIWKTIVSLLQEETELMIISGRLEKFQDADLQLKERATYLSAVTKARLEGVKALLEKKKT